jgi:hypothetical protein
MTDSCQHNYEQQGSILSRIAFMYQFPETGLRIAENSIVCLNHFDAACTCMPVLTHITQCTCIQITYFQFTSFELFNCSNIFQMGLLQRRFSQYPTIHCSSHFEPDEKTLLSISSHSNLHRITYPLHSRALRYSALRYSVVYVGNLVPSL